MLKNNKGLFLAEAMYAFFILMIVFLISFPALNRISHERMAIKEMHQAVNILQYELIQWRINDIAEKDQIIKNGLVYHLSWHDMPKDELKLCISWQGSNQRGLSRCVEGKK
ncbi:hypothetical protein EV207_10335 [Scopulibacillus darangshiensis]|uniref:Competence protein ComGE n=1 Tax=Scopulibacillus darangshiensis TaxID=442528 RepID=A0A4R2PA74_9BACL|nr:hypothetical protein [Scopulibacillus darangshiensis]TCP31154.1 hypothetical protein EV207_10335 [Scopulibacillus darangshiensis]